MFYAGPPNGRKTSCPTQHDLNCLFSLGHENDDAFFAWKNIEYWNGDAWTRRIEEVTIKTYDALLLYLVHTSMFTTQIWMNSVNKPIAFTVDQRNIIPARDATLPHVPPHEPAKRPATTP
jgi:hypothetical protein